jgi:hypothetical protein
MRQELPMLPELEQVLEAADLLHVLHEVTRDLLVLVPLLPYTPGALERILARRLHLFSNYNG